MKPKGENSDTNRAVVCSVCIANFNGVDLLDACIASIQAQDCIDHIEIILHDDASTDESVAYVTQNHSDVRLILSAQNVGFCIANNRMAAIARGEYLLLLNNDATLFPDAISTLLDEARRLDRPAILSLPQYDAESGDLIDMGSRLDPFLNSVPNRDTTRREVAMVAGACMWIPRALWEDLGGFPEWFGSIAEDLYLCRRARLAGHPVRALSRSGYWHKVGMSFGGGKPQGGHLLTTFTRRALSERNKTFVLTTTYPTPFMQLLLPLHLILLLVEGTLLSLFRLNSAYLAKIYLPVFTGLMQRRRELYAERKTAMAGRRNPGSGFFAVWDLMPHKLRMLVRYGLPRVH